ncbi:MAG: M20/M25/M40 family metallo-hydrolase [Solirubrobacterales bacterium]|nr:M20/M25/M40 family metallo-hydrolase [Solirubrobacterales bacterium]
MDLQQESVALLAELVALNTVNPPGNERPAIERLAAFLTDAGFTTEALAAQPDRPNLVATLGDDRSGPVLCLLGHVDTVLADADEWTHDPWSGEVADGYLWGRGSIDMKSQVAAEAVAAAARARDGWRPGSGALRLVFTADEETGGDVGARWLCERHPDKVRCDMLLNEGGGAVFEYGGGRHYGVCCAEKGIFRFTVTARGVAGHASLPRTGDNALLKLAPMLAALADPPESYAVTDAPAALLAGLGEDPGDPGAALTAIAAAQPSLRALVEPMLGVTLTPTMASASTKINVIPSRAQLRIDCRVPPGLGRDAARARIAEVLGEEVEVEFTEEVTGNQSPTRSPLMSAIDNWVGARDPGASAVPLILPGFSDSKWFRDAFPDCTAYGFFPMRHQTAVEAASLMHNADERIDVRDLGFAAACYFDLVGELLA